MRTGADHPGVICAMTAARICLRDAGARRADGRGRGRTRPSGACATIPASALTGDGFTGDGCADRNAFGDRSDIRSRPSPSPSAQRRSLKRASDRSRGTDRMVAALRAARIETTAPVKYPSRRMPPSWAGVDRNDEPAQPADAEADAITVPRRAAPASRAALYCAGADACAPTSVSSCASIFLRRNPTRALHHVDAASGPCRRTSGPCRSPLAFFLAQIRMTRPAAHA